MQLVFTICRDSVRWLDTAHRVDNARHRSITPGTVNNGRPNPDRAVLAAGRRACHLPRPESPVVLDVRHSLLHSTHQVRPRVVPAVWPVWPPDRARPAPDHFLIACGMNNEPLARTTIHHAGEARTRLDVLLDQVTEHRDQPILIYRRGKEPIALVAVAELDDWLETAAYPGKYSEDEAAGDAEHDRLARLLDGLRDDHFLLRVLEASETAAAAPGRDMSLDFEQRRATKYDGTAWKAVVRPRFLEDLHHWIQNNNRSLAKKTVSLARRILRDPLQGEPLRGQRAGEKSRRISEEHRLVYKIQGDCVHFLAARHHY